MGSIDMFKITEPGLESCVTFVSSARSPSPSGRTVVLAELICLARKATPLTIATRSKTGQAA
jgi:hypothetical protein